MDELPLVQHLQLSAVEHLSSPGLEELPELLYGPVMSWIGRSLLLSLREVIEVHGRQLAIPEADQSLTRLRVRALGPFEPRRGAASTSRVACPPNPRPFQRSQRRAL